MSDEQLIEQARAMYCAGSDDDIEIDDNAGVSRGEEGCWVQAWVYVRYPHNIKGATP